MDIPAQAVKYLGERGEPTERVFSGFKYGVWISTYLRKWCNAAGITKKELTFHCGRHTFAVLMLDLGTDLFHKVQTMKAVSYTHLTLPTIA